MAHITHLLLNKLVVAVIALLYVCCVAANFVGVMAAPASAKAQQSKTIPLPSQAAILSQSFYVSIMTQSFGMFNASLRMHSSINFPEHIHGELVLLGDVEWPTSLESTQETKIETQKKILPHFSRQREMLDDGLSLLPPTSSEHKEKSKERPSLLAFDVNLQNIYASHGDVKIYYLPANITHLQQVREAIEDGDLQPTVNTSFDLSTLPPVFTESLMSNVAGLSRVSSGKFNFYQPLVDDKIKSKDAMKSSNNNNEGNNGEGDYSLRFFSEHEFTINIHLPLGENGTLERIWMHTYTPPSKQLYNRAEAQTFMQRHGFTIFAIIGVFLNVLLGIFGHRFQPKPQSAATSTTPSTNTVTSSKKKS